MATYSYGQWWGSPWEAAALASGVEPEVNRARKLAGKWAEQGQAVSSKDEGKPTFSLAVPNLKDLQEKLAPLTWSCTHT